MSKYLAPKLKLLDYTKLKCDAAAFLVRVMDKHELMIVGYIEGDEVLIKPSGIRAPA